MISRRIIDAMLWSSVIVLSLIGVFAGLGRALDLSSTLASDNPHSTATSAREQAMLDGAAGLLGLERSSEKYLEVQTQNETFNVSYVGHPVITLLHVVPGALLLGLAPLQFSRRIRSRYIRFHRWSGRILLIAALLAAYSAFFFGLQMPYGGVGEAAATVVFGGLFVFAAGRAYVAIRRGDVTRHREWMIRMFATAIGISTIRLVFPPVAAFSTAPLPTQFAVSLWIGWLLTLAMAEMWIRSTRNSPRT